MFSSTSRDLKTPTLEFPHNHQFFLNAKISAVNKPESIDHLLAKEVKGGLISIHSIFFHLGPNSIFGSTFLSTGTGFTLFYDEQVIHPHDIHLYTNATPSVGFGSFHNGRYFAARWPLELASECQVTSSSLFEIYSTQPQCPINHAVHVPPGSPLHTNMFSEQLMFSVTPMLSLTFLLHFSFQKFRSVAPLADTHPTSVPPYLVLAFNL